LLADRARLEVEDIRGALGTLMPRAVEETPPVPGYREACEAFERQLLRDALQRCAGNVPEAARQLGLGRSTLYKKLVALGIQSQ